ncbi:MAG: dihydroorotase [Spirochaetia bacterium]|jgi:dihydroorotase|nr:dihydroorotase [Spirochaetia bacterium]
MLIIRNGLLIDPLHGWQKKADLQIADGKITGISQHIEKGRATEYIDAEGMLVFPGLIDVHAHFRDPGFTYKEDICTGSEAAIAGGYTKVVCMGNTQPRMDNEKALAYFYQKAKATPLKLYTVANVTEGMEGKRLTDMDALRSYGAVGFSDDGSPIMDTKLVAEAMEKAKALDCPISLHEEDQNFIGVHGINDGKVAELLQMKGAMDLAESSMVARDCVFAVHTKAKVDFQHISSQESVEIIRFAKQFSPTIFAEATPQHLSFNETEILRSGTNAKLNPPFRTEKDRMVLIEGVRDSTLNLIATDHAPHSIEEKGQGFLRSPSGIIGLETALSAVYEMLVKKHGMTMVDVLRLLTTNPASLYGFELPSLQKGATADLVVFDPQAQWVYTSGKSKSSNSPFLQKTLQGKVVYTIIDGKIVYKDRTNE